MNKPMTIYTTNLKKAKATRKAMRSAVENDMPLTTERQHNPIYVNVGGIITAIHG
jgi:hypothetical protein